MEWYVYRHDINSNTIVKYNIFDHAGFATEVNEVIASDLPYSDFAKSIKNLSMYYFWSRAEHEIVITSWPPYISKFELNQLSHKESNNLRHLVNLEIGEKIGIYDQLAMNWDVFIKYIWEEAYRLD